MNNIVGSYTLNCFAQLGEDKRFPEEIVCLNLDGCLLISDTKAEVLIIRVNSDFSESFIKNDIHISKVEFESLNETSKIKLYGNNGVDLVEYQKLTIN